MFYYLMLSSGSIHLSLPENVLFYLFFSILIEQFSKNEQNVTVQDHCTLVTVLCMFPNSEFSKLNSRVMSKAEKNVLDKRRRKLKRL